MPNEEHFFSKIFYTLYKMLTKEELGISNYDLLEESLVDVVQKVLGAAVVLNYKGIIDKNFKGFAYSNEVSKLFENIIINYKKEGSIVSSIKNYGENYLCEASGYKYANILLKNIYRLYSNNRENVLILKFDDCYRIDQTNNLQGRTPMPSIYIDNIANLDKLLEEYINKIQNSDSFYKCIYSSDPQLLTDETIGDIFYWTLLNININETQCLEDYFKKYIDFLDQGIYKNIMSKPLKVGELFEDNVYAVAIRKNISYETPYWLSFILEKNRFCFPLVASGIYEYDDEMTAEIVTVQDSQAIPFDINRNNEIKDRIKKESPKTHNFREHNPTHLFSILFTIGYLNGANITSINVCTYMPFRYQRQVIENNKSDEEIDSFQNRVAMKNLYSWFRILEFTEDIVVENYPDNGTFLSLKLNNEIKFNNNLFQKVYDLGYNAGREANNYKSKEI
ncbi:MAG: hypothetical protein J5634_04185 [Bacilli bacterium]|nr:hypothetical protein [Bacilli bacterium]